MVQPPVGFDKAMLSPWVCGSVQSASAAVKASPHVTTNITPTGDFRDTDWAQDSLCRFQAASQGWLVRGLMKMRVGYSNDESSQAQRRVSFWSTGGISPVELLAAVGILVIMVGIMAGTMLR
jgi:hypothetical protein